MAAKGCCALCLRVAELRISHIIPSFVYNWKKNSSATGYMRNSLQPNKRAQDGTKLRLLCGDCEKLFSGFEGMLAQKLFRPLVNVPDSNIPYEEWLMRFCVSVSWRTAIFLSQNNHAPHFSEHQKNLKDKALAHWASYLKGEVANPSVYEQHLVWFNGISDKSEAPNWPHNINRYLLRTVEMDLVASSEQAFVYSKMGPLGLFGIFQRPSAKWSNTKVNLKRGKFRSIEVSQLPKKLKKYLGERARLSGGVHVRLSENQQSKIMDAVKIDLDRYENSMTYHAMDLDVKLFGYDAVVGNALKGSR